MIFKVVLGILTVGKDYYITVFKETIWMVQPKVSPTMQILTSLAHKPLHCSKVAIYDGFCGDQREPSPMMAIKSNGYTRTREMKWHWGSGIEQGCQTYGLQAISGNFFVTGAFLM